MEHENYSESLGRNFIRSTFSLFNTEKHSNKSFSVRLLSPFVQDFFYRSFKIFFVISSYEEFFPRWLYHFRIISTNQNGTEFPSIK